MSYIPKSKINIKETTGKEFQSKETKKPYIGKYIQLSNGKLHIGNDPMNLGSELEPIESKKGGNFGSARDTKVYSYLKPTILKQVTKYREVPFHKNTPTEEDYEIGYFIRYFVKRVNESFGYKEINKKTYTDLISASPKYDTNLYKAGKIKWALKGNVVITNSNLIRRLRVSFPNLNIIYPQLDEFNRPEVINNQFAQPKTLYYKNQPGREYVGPYHIHPSKGPMVGAEHTTTPHEALIFSKDLLKKDIPVNTQSSTTNETSTRPMTMDTPTGPSGGTSSGGGTSGGGGSGY